jgi:hypothetical protein
MTGSERIILALVDAGFLRIDPDGSIWRVQTRTRTGRLKTLPEPTRADYERPDGYRRGRAGVDGREVTASANHMVWMATNRRIVPPRHEINHLDGKRGNNHPTNLEPATKGEVLRHAYQKLGRWRPTGERCQRGKLTAAQVAEIRAKRAAGDGMCSLATQFGVTRRAVRLIVSGQAWRDRYLEAVN